MLQKLGASSKCCYHTLCNNQRYGWLWWSLLATVHQAGSLIPHCQAHWSRATRGRCCKSFGPCAGKYWVCVPAHPPPANSFHSLKLTLWEFDLKHWQHSMFRLIRWRSSCQLNNWFLTTLKYEVMQIGILGRHWGFNRSYWSTRGRKMK